MGRNANWLELLSGTPGLVTTADPAQLKPDAIPAGYGLNATIGGRIAAGSIPTGTARVVKTFSGVGDGSGSTATYYWHYNRLWRYSGSILYFGAPGYTGYYFPQGLGQIDLLDDTGDITGIVPFGVSALAVLKAAGVYIISDAADPSGRFSVQRYNQAGGVSSASYALGLGDLLLFCNANGLFAMQANGDVAELSLPVRGQTWSKTITADYGKSIVVMSTTYAYDVVLKKWFDYSTAGFRLDSRVVRMPAGEPFTVDGVALEYTNSAGTDLSVIYQARVNNGDWEESETINLPYDGENECYAMRPLDAPQVGRAFQLRLLTCPAGIGISRILIRGENFTVESRGE